MRIAVLHDQNPAAGLHRDLVPHPAADVVGAQRPHVDRLVSDPAVVDLRADQRRTAVEQHENFVGIVVHVQFHDAFQRLLRRIVQECDLPFVPDQKRGIAVPP